MEQTLLNEIVARVAAKLAEAEGGEAAPAAADRDDREGLLLLSQEMNDTCRAMLKCEKLKARFRVDCASLQSEPAELDSYGVVVLTGLTNEALAKLALFLVACALMYTALLFVLSLEQVAETFRQEAPWMLAVGANLLQCGLPVYQLPLPEDGNLQLLSRKVIHRFSLPRGLRVKNLQILRVIYRLIMEAQIVGNGLAGVISIKPV